MGEPGPRPSPRFLIGEDRRLRARYAELTAMLVSGAEASLDLAAERLLARPELVAALLGGPDLRSGAQTP